MAKVDFMQKLLSFKGAIKEKRNVHANVLETPSPSLNYIFGKGWGLPIGFTMMLMGPPRGGKTVICNAMIGQLLKNDPTAFAAKFDTERREEGQMTPLQEKAWGIDNDRYVVYQTRDPAQIFDRVENEFPPLIEQGMNLKLLVIDSLNNVRGRRSLNTDTIETQNRGDSALTIQEGLSRILDVQRDYGFGLIFTCQIRAQQQVGGYQKFEDSSWDYQDSVRPALSFAPQHYAEYYVYVGANNTEKGRTTALEEKLEDTEHKDMMGKSEKFAHKCRVKMLDSSFGPKGRVGEFMFHDNLGIINTHEEVFALAVNHGILERPNQLTYKFGDETYRSKAAILSAIEEKKELREALLRELKRRDLEGTLSSKPNPVE